MHALANTERQRLGRKEKNKQVLKRSYMMYREKKVQQPTSVLQYRLETKD